MAYHESHLIVFVSSDVPGTRPDQLILRLSGAAERERGVDRPLWRPRIKSGDMSVMVMGVMRSFGNHNDVV